MKAIAAAGVAITLAFAAGASIGGCHTTWPAACRDADALWFKVQAAHHRAQAADNQAQVVTQQWRDGRGAYEKVDAGDTTAKKFIDDEDKVTDQYRLAQDMCALGGH